MRVFLHDGFDVIHAHHPPDAFGFIGAFYKLMGKRYVLDHHDLAPELYYARFGGSGNRFVYRVLVGLEKLSCGFADHVIATNQSYEAVEIKRGHVLDSRITIVAARLKAAREELARLTPQARHARLQTQMAAKLGDIEPNRRPEATVHWKKQIAGAAVEGITLEVEPGIVLPLLLLRPPAVGPARLPVVVAVSQGGKERILAHRSSEIEALLKVGVAVCLPDVRGIGETSPDPRRGLNSEEDSPSATELMLGNTLLCARLKDLRTVLAYLGGRPELDPQRIGLWGDSFVPVNPSRLLLDELPGWQIGPEIQQQAEPLGGLLALLGGLYEDGIRAVAVRRGLAGYLSVLDDQFACVPNDIIAPGILEVGDVGDVAAALSPRPLLLEGLVDGRNRIVPTAGLRGRLAPVYESYQAFPKRLLIRDEEGTPSLAQWLVEHL